VSPRLAAVLLCVLVPARAAQDSGGAEQGREEQQQGETQETQEKKDPPPPVPAPETQDPKPAPAGDAGGTPPASEAPPPALTPASPAPLRAPVAWPLDGDGLAAVMHELALTYPALCTLQPLGRSSSGREILSLTITDASRPAAGKPALLLVDHQGRESCGPEAALELAWRLCERQAADENVRALLARTTLVIAPALDPDTRAATVPSPGRVSFERNFPSGWEPETLRQGAGRTSLCQPETLAAARFLAVQEPAAVLLGFAPVAPARAPYPEAELPAGDRAVFARIASALELPGRPAVVPWYELGSPGGSLFDFAYQARGMFPLALPLPGEDERTPEALAAWNAEVLERVLACLALLPRLEVVQEGLERLAADTWQLDLRLGNGGVVPTLSSLALRRELGADVALRLSGAKLVATAQRPDGEGGFQDASFHAGGARSTLSGGTLAGGEGRWLRLILEAPSGTTVEIQATSPWAGSAGLTLVLP